MRYPGQAFMMHLIKLISIFTACFVGLAGIARGGTFPHSGPSDLDRETASKLEMVLNQSSIEIGVPGAVAAVALPGGAFWFGSSGVAMITAQQTHPATGPPPLGAVSRLKGPPMQPNLKFHVGSISKTFVATAVLQLVQDKVLTLDDTLFMWLGDLFPEANRITIRQLLNHTSGIPDYAVHQGFFPDLFRQPDHRWQINELMAYARKLGPAFAPGRGWRYSNTNYLLLGRIISKATGQSYDRLVTERIIKPLSLNDTLIPSEAALPAGSSHGYRYNFLKTRGRWTDVAEYAHPTFMGAAGALISNAPDLLTWLDAWLSGRLINRELLEEMLTFTPTGQPDRLYGLGVEARNKEIGHGGDYVFGYQARICRWQNINFVIMTNGLPTKLGLWDGPGYIFKNMRQALFSGPARAKTHDRALEFDGLNPAFRSGGH